MINIRANTAKLLKEEFNIEESVTARLFERGLLKESDCRNVLIKNEYNRKVRPKEKQRLKGSISERYCISVDLVRKLVE